MSGSTPSRAVSRSPTIHAFIAVVECCSAAHWQLAGVNERTVGVLAQHVAESHRLMSDWAQAIANGEAPARVTKAMIIAQNAQHAAQHANCTKEETLDLLRRNGAAAVTMVHAMSDAQLERAAHFSLFEGSASTEQMLDILIGHPQAHLQTIRTATGL